MSLSSNQSQEPAKISHLPVSPLRPMPALEKKPATEQPEEPLSIEEMTVPVELPEEQEEKAAEPKAKEPEETPKKKSNWQDIALDTLLVSLVIAVVGGGSYYIKTQRDLYRVPDMVEQADARYEELCKEREALQDMANHADEQLRMREKLKALDERLQTLTAKSAELSDSIAEQQNRVLALQHEIRRSDKEARKVARGLLPGFYVGDVTTTRGKSYAGAIITRYENKRLSVRNSYGAASIPAAELVKDRLPEIVQYALGFVNLVDMSDFTTDGAAPAAPKASAASTRTSSGRTSSSSKKEVDYEPSSKGPVVDTQANKTEAPDDGLVPQT